VGAEKQAHPRRRKDAREASGPDDRRPPGLPAKIGVPILKAWNVKEDLMDLLALHGTNPDGTQISALLIRFYENAAACGLPEMERLAGTVSTWWPEILAQPPRV
jgi:hypothetical protein